MLDTAKLGQFVGQVWNDSIVPTLVDYIRVPNKSPAFDPDWAAHGHMEAAVAMFERWARDRLTALPGAILEIVRLPGRTPLILIEVPGKGAETVLLYGHLDKQPEMVGWAEGYGPWIPRLEGDKLYGRGGADDGYAMFAALTALAGLREQGVPHARCVILIEACEESGSYDLPYYVEHLSARIGSPSLVICLDSGCGNYDQLWLTTSLRGIAAGTLTVRISEDAVHSGDAGNVLLPYTTAKLSLRLPPTLDAESAGKILQRLLEDDPPYGAQIGFAPQAASAGWNAPALARWLEQSLARASEAAFGAPPAYMGEGGSIPFMAMLGERFPQAQFVVTGVLGPHSNAHGPNEFLHIPTGRRVTQVIAQVLADHATRAG